MKLTDARDNTIAALTEGLSARRPLPSITGFAGTFTLDDARKMYTRTPAVLVTPMTVDDTGVKVVVYVLTKSTDADPADLVDTVVEIIRGLPGSGRALLDVAARSLYDADTGKAGMNLWAIVFVWPHLAVGDAAEVASGPLASEIARIKQVIIDQLGAEFLVASSEADLSAYELSGSLPFASIAPGEGLFETAPARIIKYMVGEVLYKRSIIGKITWPIEITFWSTSAAQAENQAMAVLSLLPITEESGGLNEKTAIDKVQQMQKQSAEVFAITVRREVAVATDPVVVPTFKQAGTAPDNS